MGPVRAHVLRSVDRKERATGHLPVPGRTREPAVPFGHQAERGPFHPGPCQREQGLAHIRRLRAVPDGHRQAFVHRQPRIAVRYRQGRFRTGPHHHLGKLYTRGLGARQIFEGRGKDAYAARPARQHTDVHTRYRR